MPKNDKQKLNESSFAAIVFNCFINALISFLVFVILSLIINSLSLKSSFVSGNTRLILTAILIVSAVINGIMCARRIKIKAIASSSASALIGSALLFILFSAIGNFNFGIGTLISILVYIAVTVISAIVFKNLIR